MEKKMIKGALVSMLVICGVASPAWAEMPQTDSDLVERLASKTSDETWSAVEK